MTDKELDELAEQEAYKAYGFSKRHIKAMPFWGKVITFIGILTVVFAIFMRRGDAFFYGVVVFFCGNVMTPYVVGYSERQVAMEKEKALKRLREKYGEHADDRSQDNSRHDGTRR